MKRIANRSRLLWALFAVFIGGLGFLLYSLITNADTWAMNRANNHLFRNGQLQTGGTVFDTNHVELVHSENGKRIYNGDATVRKATLHAVGDRTGSIATGIQSIYNSQLTGYNLVNGVYRIKKYGKGNNITLTIDSAVNAVAYERLAGHKGTIGVYNYKTGEIICMVSTPSYDVDHVPEDIETHAAYEGAYMNRFLSALYAPGSTFKTVTALSALENIPDILGRKWTCTGVYDAGDGKVECNGVHGELDMNTALGVSCNSVFAAIAGELGADKLRATAEKAGLTSQAVIDGIKGSTGKFDVTGENKAELGWAGIGQATDLVTPVQMMRYMGAIANGGTAVSPTLIESVKSQAGFRLSSGTKTVTEELMSRTNADTIKTMMRNAVVNVFGDGNYPGLNLCAKSGTAQLDDKESTAWFAGFMDSEEYPFAFVVAIEEGGSGSRIAGPAANAVLQKAVSQAKSRE